jgi:hypothetical protein
MKYLKKYDIFETVQIKQTKLYSDILAVLGYYSTNDESLRKIADGIYNKYDGSFTNTIVNHSMDSYLPDDSPRLVYHASNEDFNKFNTPSFFGDADGAYNADILYCCVINLQNPLDLRSTGNDNKKWIELLKDIFKDDENIDDRIEMAEKYADAYGFFKLLFNAKDVWGGYRWDLITNYITKHGYDGAIFRESDQSISYYFNGYLVMKPEQIQILYKEK